MDRHTLHVEKMKFVKRALELKAETEAYNTEMEAQVVVVNQASLTLTTISQQRLQLLKIMWAVSGYSTRLWGPWKGHMRILLSVIYEDCLVRGFQVIEEVDRIRLDVKGRREQLQQHRRELDEHRAYIERMIASVL